MRPRGAYDASAEPVGDLPVAIVIVDTEQRIEAFLPELDELITEGLVILDPVRVIKYAGQATP